MTEKDVRAKRIELKLSQLKVAKLAQVSRWRLRLAEEGYTKFRPEELKRIAIVFQQTARSARETEKQVSEALRELEAI